jgi:hypothetical protein
MPSTSADGKEARSGQMQYRDGTQTAFSLSQMTPRTPQKQTGSQNTVIQAAPKKSTVKSTIEENEENEENDEPSTPTRPSLKPATKPVEAPNTVNGSQPPSNPSKMLLETVIGMIKRSRGKLDMNKISAAAVWEVIPELDDVISFMETLQTIEDNMATVKR